MPRPFDVVVFDWYATLGAPAPDDWWNKMFSLIENAGGVIPESAVGGWTTPLLEHVEASLSEATYRSYEDQQLRELFEACGLSQEVQDALAPEVLELRELESIAVFSDVVELLEELRGAGVTLALCSNWSWDLARHLDYNEIRSYFDIVICSAIVGYRKPHPSIFQALLAQLEPLHPQLERSRIAFVGDDWNADIEGASSIGLTPFHVARTGCTVGSHAQIPCVRDLREIERYLLGQTES
jgi:HAD superfamily hydrolase (TIGR01549 family)